MEDFFRREKKEYIVFPNSHFNGEGNVTFGRSLGQILVLDFIFVNVIKEILTPCNKCAKLTIPGNVHVLFMLSTVALRVVTLLPK